MKHSYDVIIIGAGAAGLMCAIEAGKRKRRVLLLDHMQKIAEKIRISGGGRCNFTNLHAKPENFLSSNPHFCKSALSQYTQNDFIALLQKHGISFHEKKLGQLFCNTSSSEIIDMLLKEINDANVVLKTGIKIHNIQSESDHYIVTTEDRTETCASLVIATGGLSIPKIGATNFGYEIAKKFSLNVVEPRAGLVPLTFNGPLLEKCQNLSGISIDASVSCRGTIFSEGLLFTHKGLSGPSILQISSYWQNGEEIIINLAPEMIVSELLKTKKQSAPKQNVTTVLAEILPKRLTQSIADEAGFNGTMAEITHTQCGTLGKNINEWRIIPSGTEGYRTAEVTLGGVDTKELSSKTMQAIKQPGLFFIGEVVDVTGHLGGFNFQWAWSSGYAAGQHV